MTGNVLFARGREKNATCYYCSFSYTQTHTHKKIICPIFLGVLLEAEKSQNDFSSLNIWGLGLRHFLLSLSPGIFLSSYWLSPSPPLSLSFCSLYLSGQFFSQNPVGKKKKRIISHGLILIFLVIVVHYSSPNLSCYCIFTAIVVFIFTKWFTNTSNEKYHDNFVSVRCVLYLWFNNKMFVTFSKKKMLKKKKERQTQNFLPPYM